MGHCPYKRDTKTMGKEAWYYKREGFSLNFCNIFHLAKAKTFFK